MNLNIYKEYRFFSGKLTSAKTGKEYKFSLKDDDRFYIYLKPYIIKEKVEGLTQLMIDEIVISDTDNTFFDEKSFALSTVLLAKDQNDYVHSFSLTMEGLTLNFTNVSKRSYSNEEWTLTLYELQIPYNKDITIVEIKDED